VRFKLDENLPIALLDDLRTAGHDADGLRDEGLIGAPDDAVLDLARRENRVLLTLDKGNEIIRTVWRTALATEPWGRGKRRAKCARLL